MAKYSPVSDIVKGINSLHLYFRKMLPLKDKILKEHLDKPMDWMEINEIEFAKQYILCAWKDNITLPIPFKVDKKSNIKLVGVKLIKDYPNKYLINTILKELIYVVDRSLEDKIKSITYLLYYWEFFKSDDIKDIVTGVVSDLEDIIKVLITREETLYRNFNTDEILINLRRAHTSERLIPMGNVSRGINLRRR